MKRPTLDKILSDLETAKQMAIEDRHITGIITASMAQAKLLGFDKGEVTDNEAMPVKVVVKVQDCRKLTDDDITRNADGSFYIN